MYAVFPLPIMWLMLLALTAWVIGDMLRVMMGG